MVWGQFSMKFQIFLMAVAAILMSGLSNPVSAATVTYESKCDLIFEPLANFEIDPRVNTDCSLSKKFAPDEYGILHQFTFLLQNVGLREIVSEEYYTFIFGRNSAINPGYFCNSYYGCPLTRIAPGETVSFTFETTPQADRFNRQPLLNLRVAAVPISGSATFLLLALCGVGFVGRKGRFAHTTRKSIFASSPS
jgi:hypothetical protein